MPGNKNRPPADLPDDDTTPPTPEGGANYRERIKAIQEQFRSLNTLGETDIIAAWQTTESLLVNSASEQERAHLEVVQQAIKARMQALISNAESIKDHIEKYRLRDVFRAVLGDRW